MSPAKDGEIIINETLVPQGTLPIENTEEDVKSVKSTSPDYFGVNRISHRGKLQQKNEINTSYGKPMFNPRQMPQSRDSKQLNGGQVSNELTQYTFFSRD